MATMPHASPVAAHMQSWPYTASMFAQTSRTQAPASDSMSLGRRCAGCTCKGSAHCKCLTAVASRLIFIAFGLLA